MKHIIVVNPNPPDATTADERHFVLTLEYAEDQGAVDVVVTDRLGIRQGATVAVDDLEEAVRRLAAIAT